MEGKQASFREEAIIDDLNRKLEYLKEVLKFYSDESLYVDGGLIYMDKGNNAKFALKQLHVLDEQNNVVEKEVDEIYQKAIVELQEKDATDALNKLGKISDIIKKYED